MIVKTKVKRGLFDKRLEGKGKIMEVFVNENLDDLDRSTIEICFKGRESSGVLVLNKAELDSIQKTVGKVKIKKF